MGGVRPQLAPFSGLRSEAAELERETQVTLSHGTFTFRDQTGSL